MNYPQYEQEWMHYDQEGAMRQRFLEIDDRTEDLRDMVDRSLGWDSFLELYDITWLYHENGLEGVVLTYPEIKSAVDNQIISDVSLLPTYQEIKNQKQCIDMIREKAKNKRFHPTINFLKELHGILIEDEELAGNYRQDIPIHRTYFHSIEEPKSIEKQLQATLDYMRKRDRDLHPIEFASNIHHMFMHVFPFSKYSGFIGRLLINFVLARFGYVPAVIHATDRQRYYEALRGPMRDFRAFLAEAIENSLENSMRFINAHREAEGESGQAVG